MGFLGRVMIEFARKSIDEWKIILLIGWGIIGAVVCGGAGFIVWFKMRKYKTINLDLIAFLLGATIGWLLTLSLGLYRFG